LAGYWRKTQVTLTGFVLLLLTAFCIALANLLFKNGISHAGGFPLSFSALLKLVRLPVSIAGVVLTGIAALMWFRILATQKLSTSYPLFVSLTYTLITLASFYFFHEKISVQKLVGLAIIIFGITAVARG
jgi:multidrug transporter EmrE-like cation transporter